MSRFLLPIVSMEVRRVCRERTPVMMFTMGWWLTVVHPSLKTGDIELTTYLVNTSGPGSLVLDLRITHERFGSSSDPSINGHSHSPHAWDRTSNESATDKIPQYRADYNNRPSNAISFMPAIASTSGRLHSEFVCLLSPHSSKQKLATSSPRLQHCGSH